MSDYDPVKCLQAEVDRFKATNTFTPMQVTGFYLQAACVLTELRLVREERDRLLAEVKNLRRRVDSLILDQVIAGDKPKDNGKLKCEGCFFCQTMQSDILELFCAHPYCTGRVAVKTKHSPLRYVSGRGGRTLPLLQRQGYS